MIDGEIVVIPDFRLKVEVTNKLPKVPDTPPMPKVKDPKPNWYEEEYGGDGEYPGKIRIGDTSLPRKEVISIQPGDLVALTTPYHLEVPEIDVMKRSVARLLPDGTNVIVLSGGATLEVYREQVKETKGDGYFEDEIVKDLHHIMALIAKDKKTWTDLGYDGDGYTAEEIIGFMLKSLAERGSKIACSGKIEDIRTMQ